MIVMSPLEDCVLIKSRKMASRGEPMFEDTPEKLKHVLGKIPGKRIYRSLALFLLIGRYDR